MRVIRFSSEHRSSLLHAGARPFTPPDHVELRAGAGKLRIKGLSIEPALRISFLFKVVFPLSSPRPVYSRELERSHR